VSGDPYDRPWRGSEWAERVERDWIIRERGERDDSVWENGNESDGPEDDSQEDGE
jgi:hypothetical protein